MQLIERMNKHLLSLKESDSHKLESILRQLLSEEQEATSHYLKFIGKVEDLAKDEDEEGPIGHQYSVVLRTLMSIANEEKAHIGELQKLIEITGCSSKDYELNGAKEVEEIDKVKEHK